MRIAKPVVAAPKGVTLIHAPRWASDRHPWLQKTTGMRWTSSEVQEVTPTPEFKLGTDGPRTGDGTSLELARAATVARTIARTYRAEIGDFFIAGHQHEQLSKGSVSVAWEGAWDGDSPWTYVWPETAMAKAVATKLGVRFEAINGCILAVIPE